MVPYNLCRIKTYASKQVTHYPTLVGFKHNLHKVIFLFNNYILVNIYMVFHVWLLICGAKSWCGWDYNVTFLLAKKSSAQLTDRCYLSSFSLLSTSGLHILSIQMQHLILFVSIEWFFVDQECQTIYIFIKSISEIKLLFCHTVRVPIVGFLLWG